MSWISRNNWWWYILTSSGLLDQTLLMSIGPCLEVLGWSVTSSYKLFKWWNTKPPKERVVVLECNPSYNESSIPEEFIVVSVSDRQLT